MSEVREAIKVLAAMFEDSRGLDGDTVRELDLSRDDLLGLMATVSAVLEGYLVAPDWVRNPLLVAGAMVQTGIKDEGMVRFIFDDARGKDAMRQVNAMNATRDDRKRVRR